MPIEERETMWNIHDKLSEAGAKLLSETFPLLLEGKLEPLNKMMKKQHLLPILNVSKKKLIGLKTGEEIYNHIRGLNPWPVAFTTLQVKL